MELFWLRLWIFRFFLFPRFPFSHPFAYCFLSSLPVVLVENCLRCITDRRVVPHGGRSKTEVPGKVILSFIVSFVAVSVLASCESPGTDSARSCHSFPSVLPLRCRPSFNCLVEEWKDCEELKPQPREKLIFDDKKRKETRHRTECCCQQVPMREMWKRQQIHEGAR